MNDAQRRSNAECRMRNAELNFALRQGVGTVNTEFTETQRRFAFHRGLSVGSSGFFLLSHNAPGNRRCGGREHFALFAVGHSSCFCAGQSGRRKRTAIDTKNAKGGRENPFILLSNIISSTGEGRGYGSHRGPEALRFSRRITYFFSVIRRACPAASVSLRALC